MIKQYSVKLISCISTFQKVVAQLKSLGPHEHYKDPDFQGISSLCIDETNISENIKNKDIYWKRPRVSYSQTRIIRPKIHEFLCDEYLGVANYQGLELCE